MNKEKLDMWHKDKNNFRNLVIDINGSDISDIIVYNKQNKSFTNTVSKETSKKLYEVVRPDKRYIVLNEDCARNRMGVYIKADKEHDMLMYIYCNSHYNAKTKSFEWMEINREYASMNYEKSGDCKTDYYFDICGQSLSFGSNDPTIDVDEDYYSQENCIIAPAGAKEEAMKYFNGLPLQTYSFGIGVSLYKLKYMESFYFLSCAMETHLERRNEGLDGYIHYNVIEYVTAKTDHTFMKGPLPLPKEVETVLNMTAKKWLRAVYRKTVLCGLKIENEDINPFLVIQKINGKMVARLFWPEVIYGNSILTTRVELIEFVNVVLDDFLSHPRSLGIKETLVSIPVWCDSMDGTELERFSSYVTNGTKILHDYLEKNSFLKAKEKTDSIMKEKYMVDVTLAVNALIVLTKNRTLEAVMKIKPINHPEKYRKFKEKLLERSCISLSYSILHTNFGTLNEAKSKLHEKLVLPKGLLEYAIENDRYKCIKYIKDVFCPQMSYAPESDKTTYFMRLNKEDFKFFFDSMDTAVNKLSIDYSTYSEVIGLLVDIYGYSKWKTYLRHLQNMVSEDFDDDVYYEYLTMIDEELPREIAKKTQWKLSGEALQKSYDSLLSFCEARQYEKDEELMEAFKQRAKELEKYKLHKAGLHIKIPESYMDLIDEGVTLRHCAKDFVRMHAGGGTNILLIRKDEEPDKPYFTLEVRGGQIRQCHGMCNRDVDGYSDVKVFLENFCKKYDMHLSYGRNLKGLDD